MGRKRQEIQSAEFKGKILEMAKYIIENQGLEALSIRKITMELDYSPSIIYHYFENKDQIISTVIEAGYRTLLGAIASVECGGLGPSEELSKRLTAYVGACLHQREMYKIILLSDNPEIVAKTGVLTKGISDVSPSMMLLKALIQRGIDEGEWAAGDAELLAQNVWLCIYGLISRLISEKELPVNRVADLIEAQIQFIIRGLKQA